LKKTIVAFAAHPDDLEFSSTGTLIKLKKEGYRLIYVVVTNGENGFKMEGAFSAKERAEIRAREQLAVAEKLGVEDVLFLNYRDGFLEYTEELRRQLVDIIKKFRPQIVFCFDPANRSFESLNLLHRDHRIVGEAVFDACFAAKNRYMYPRERHQVEKIYFFGSHNPNHFEDITGLIGLKLELLSCHRSQFPDFSVVEAYIRDEVSAGTTQYRYSEAFRILTVRQLT